MDKNINDFNNTINNFNPSIKNRIINGSFKIWQRGSTFGPKTTSAFSTDRWELTTANAGYQIDRIEGDLPSEINEDNLAVKITSTAAQTQTTTNNATFKHNIEGNLTKDFDFGITSSKTMTLSFWVKTSKPGTYCVALRNYSLDCTRVQQYVINYANTWEKKTVTFSTPNFGTWPTNEERGLSVCFVLLCGPNYQTSNLNTWQNGNYLASPSQTNFFNETGNTIFFAGVQLEGGSIATKFEERSIFYENELCQRYFWYTTVSQFAHPIYLNASYFHRYLTIKYPVTMRTIPNVKNCTSATNGTFVSGYPNVEMAYQDWCLLALRVSGLTEYARTLTITIDAEM